MSLEAKGASGFRRVSQVYPKMMGHLTSEMIWLTGLLSRRWEAVIFEPAPAVTELVHLP